VTGALDNIGVINHARQRLRTALPGADNIQVYPADPPFIVVGFDLEATTHTFRLKRENGIWTCREWIADGAPNQFSTKESSPRFDALILALVSPVTSRPHVDLVELRCPIDPRRLFAKLIIQHPLPKKASHQVTLEVSCPQCKRSTGVVTMHLFAMDGTLIRTNDLEPWIKKEPKAWYQAAGAVA
jgi:hypothetical protein